MPCQTPTSRDELPAGPSLPTRINGPVALIGDVHGQLELLDRLLDRLARLGDFQQRWIVLLGDLVDRGPDSRGVIERVLELTVSHPRTTVVCGNHDLAMAATLGLLPVPEEAQWPQRWTRGYQCEPTFASYGVSPYDIDGLRQAVPAAHAELLAALPWVVEHPEVLCVHAGLPNEMPLETQLKILRQRDFSLHRPPWLCRKDLGETSGPRSCPVPIASGHVPRHEVHVGSRRYLLDTTGGLGGELSGLLLPELELVTSACDPRPIRRGWWPFRKRVA
ncbi:MAG: metallophosphoesterase [Planctomycetaceae bacterium]